MSQQICDRLRDFETENQMLIQAVSGVHQARQAEDTAFKRFSGKDFASDDLKREDAPSSTTSAAARPAAATRRHHRRHHRQRRTRHQLLIRRQTQHPIRHQLPTRAEAATTSPVATTTKRSTFRPYSRSKHIRFYVVREEHRFFPDFFVPPVTELCSLSQIFGEIRNYQ